MIKYGVLVSYSYMDAIKHVFGVSSDVLAVEYVPNTPNGLEKLRSELGRLHPYHHDIFILTLTPLVGDKSEKNDDDDWE